MRERGLVGTFFEAAGGGRHPGLVVWSGSDGGELAADLHAALLASRGYDTLALAFFDPTGRLPLPKDLSLIPLEYFETAVGWLARQPGVDPNRIGVRGASRGSESALLVASRDPRIHAVIASAPSSVVWGGLPDIGQSAWSANGMPVPFLIPKVSAGRTPYEWYLDALITPQAVAATIPVERINGPVLTINGADDELWPSQTMTRLIAARLRAQHHRYRDEHLELAGNGHVVQLPNEPTTGIALPGLGGNAKDSAVAAQDAWHQSLRFLDGSLGRFSAVAIRDCSRRTWRVHGRSR